MMVSRGLCEERASEERLSRRDRHKKAKERASRQRARQTNLLCFKVKIKVTVAVRE